MWNDVMLFTVRQNCAGRSIRPAEARNAFASLRSPQAAARTQDNVMPPSRNFACGPRDSEESQPLREPR